MNNRHRIFISALAASIATTLGASAAQAADVYLRAESFTKALPTDATGTATQDVVMWGYAECDATFASCGTPSSPGPEITVPVGDTSLTVHLQNGLSEATSIMIPGQTKAMDPMCPTCTFVDGQGRTRIRAFDVEVAPGDTGDYTWPALRPGSYLYQSASFVAKQVQMGLYGAMVQDAGASAAYDPLVTYTQAKTIVYSEIDPALHEFVADGTAATSVAIVDSGFGNPVCPGACIDGAQTYYTNGAAGAWTVAGGQGGVFLQKTGGTADVTINATPDSDQVAYSNGATLTQDLGVPLVANATYTLTVSVGARGDMSFRGGEVSLQAGGTEIGHASVTAADLTNRAATATVTVPASAAPAAGNLSIVLGTGSSGQQTVFDNVSLSYSTGSFGKAANATAGGYEPRFFLINGEPYVASTAPLLSATTGDQLVLRFVNAGLQSRTAQLIGGYYTVLAEDGHPAPTQHQQFNSLLPAGKSLDVLLVPGAAGTYSIIDRRLGLVNDSDTNGGQVAHIEVTAP